MGAFLSSALIVAAAFQQGPGETYAQIALNDLNLGTIRGRVVSEQTGLPVATALVEIVGAEELVAVTDLNGNYVLGAVPVGLRTVRAFHLDHVPLEVAITVAPRSTVNLEFALEMRPVPLDTLRVSRRRLGLAPDTLPDPSLSVDESMVGSRVGALGAPGMAELGLVDALRGGGAEPPDASDVLFVRGAAADLRAVYLDGAPVYAPVHLGGMADPFFPGLLSEGRVRSGGASPRYDGGVSYILDLETRSGRSGALRSEGAIDLAVASVVFEGTPAGETNVLLAGRGVHGLGADAFGAKRLPSGYGEAFGRVDRALGDDGELSVSGYWNRESVDLGEAILGDDPVHWGNLAGSIRVEKDVGDGSAVITAAYGDFKTRLPVAGPRPAVLEGTNERRRLAADVTHDRGPFRMEFGLAFDRTRLRHEATSFLAELQLPVSTSVDVRGDAVGGYASAQFVVSPAVLLSGGIRTSGFATSERDGFDLRLAPRASVRWRATPAAVVTVGVGRYHQFVQNAQNFPSAEELIDIAAALEQREPEPPQGSLLDVAGATHFVAKLERLLGNGFRLGVEGFYKDFDTPAKDLGSDVETTGLELVMVRSGSILEASVGYTRGWVWSSGDPRFARSVFAGRELVDATLGMSLGATSLKFRSTYAAGLPFTAIPSGPVEPPQEQAAPSLSFSTTPGPETEDGSVPGARELAAGSYLRLEGEFARTWTGSDPVQPSELTVYIRVLNGLDQREAMFIQVDPNDPSSADADATKFLPIVGVRWAF
ncbi:MAG: TonB-dependent receptor [Gemmatimonadota bacterium]